MNFTHQIKLALLLASCGAVALFASSSSFAGSRANQTVSVDIPRGILAGSIGAARNSGNTVEFIRISASVGSMSIDFRNAAGVTASCSSTNASIVDAALNTPSDALLNVFFNSSGICTGYFITNQSISPAKST